MAKKKTALVQEGKFGVENIVILLKAFLGTFFAFKQEQNETGAGFIKKVFNTVKKIVKARPIKTFKDAISALPKVIDELNDMSVIEHASVVTVVQEHFGTDNMKSVKLTEKLLIGMKKLAEFIAGIYEFAGTTGLIEDEEEAPAEDINKLPFGDDESSPEEEGADGLPL